MTVLVKDYEPFSFTCGLQSLQQRLINGFRALQMCKRSSDNSFICRFLRLIAPSDTSVGFTPCRVAEALSESESRCHCDPAPGGP